MKIPQFILVCLALCGGVATPTFAQGTAFTYQGLLQEGGAALNGRVDLTFVLYDGLNDGQAVGTTNVVNDLAISNGLLNVTLDFGGGAFDGNPRWLEIAVRPAASVGVFTPLRPRTPLTATPYALFATSASASGLIGLLPDSSLPAHVARLDVGNTFHGNQILSGGRVGIGTTTPNSKLSVLETTYGIEHTDGTRRLATYIDASGCYFGTASVDPLFFYVNDGGSPLMINTNGHVGIGTSDPATALDVVGTLRATLFSGDGRGLTGIPMSSVTGVVSDAQIPASLARLEGGNTFIGNQRIHSGSLSVPNGQISVGGDLIANAHQFVAGNANVNSLNVTNGVVANSFIGDGRGLLGVAKLDGGNTFNGNQRVVGGSLEVRSAAPVVTVGTTANEGGAIHFGNAGHGVKRAYIGQNDVGLYTTAADVYLSAKGVTSDQFVLKNSGNVGIGTSDPKEKLQVSGNVTVSGAVTVQDTSGTPQISLAIDSQGKGKVTCDYIQINGGADIAEPFEIQGAHPIEPGMIVAIDPAKPGELRISNRAYDPTVAGIISGANGIQPGLMLQQNGTVATGRHPVALSGRAWCYSDADAGGAIVPGDMLTSATEPGHAMKAADRDRAFGAVIGKAMTPLAKGKGLVLVLVSLQ
ncbi:MAG: hypothetical protein JNN07_14455 [Verrucomicrobiales bacterium]|nr:hypothetical protein [Verrucomicrobiales bacterium]